MEQVIIYTRVSTEEQAQEDRYSLSVQKRVCQEYADREGFKVVGIFEDPGKSATSMNRPALKAMTDYIDDNGNIYAVLVQDTDRLARNTLDHLTIRAYLKRSNCKLISISQPFIDDSPEGTMVDTVIAGFNAFQSDITGRKTKKGLEQRALSGWYPGEAPLGYLNSINDHGDRIITQDKNKAPLIKKAFELYVTGSHGAETINDLLYRKGLRGKRGKKMQLSKFYYMLKNPFYYGALHWDKKTYEGKHKPIIDKETFDMVQRIMAVRVAKRMCERKHNFLLTGFLFCKCGRRLTAEYHIKPSKRTYSYYHCTRGKFCHSSRNVPIEDLEKQVEEKFKEVTFSEDFFNKLIIGLKHYYDNYHKENQKQVSELNYRKADLTKKRNRLEDLLIDMKISEDTYKRKNQGLVADLEIIENEIKRLSSKGKFDIGKFEDLIEFSKDIYNSYKYSSPDGKRNYLNFFWEKFIVEDKNIIQAIPTEPYKLLQSIQKPLLKGEFVAYNKFIKPLVWGGRWGSNPRPSGPQPDALPTELLPPCQ